MARAGKRKWVWVGAAVLGCMIVLLVIVLRPPAKPEAEIVFLEAEHVLKEPNRLQRWAEALRSKLVKPQTVWISAEIISSEKLTSLEEAPRLIRREPLAEKEGVQVWIVHDDGLSGISNAFWFSRTNLIANPRMVTDDGQIGSTFIGSSAHVGGSNIAVGLTMRMKALRGETNTDLFLGVTDTEVMPGTNGVSGAALRTNFYVGARVQLRAQHRVLFVCERKDGKGPVCVFVSATWLPIK